MSRPIETLVYRLYVCPCVYVITAFLQNDEAGFVDLGGAYVGNNQRRILRHIRNLGLTLYKVHDVQDTVRYSKVNYVCVCVCVRARVCVCVHTMVHTMKLIFSIYVLLASQNY